MSSKLGLCVFGSLLSVVSVVCSEAKAVEITHVTSIPAAHYFGCFRPDGVVANVAALDKHSYRLQLQQFDADMRIAQAELDQVRREVSSLDAFRYQDGFRLRADRYRVSQTIAEENLRHLQRQKAYFVRQQRQARAAAYCGSSSTNAEQLPAPAEIPAEYLYRR